MQNDLIIYLKINMKPTLLQTVCIKGCKIEATEVRSVSLQETRKN